jgi:hypothetical protein
VAYLAVERDFLPDALRVGSPWHTYLEEVVKFTRTAAVSMAAAGVLALGGCSSFAASHDHNAPPASNDIRAHWRYIRSPGSFQTIIYTCIGSEGYYETQDNAYPIVIVPQDPLCGFKGTVQVSPKLPSATPSGSATTR